jgi:hypothetical protein
MVYSRSKNLDLSFFGLYSSLSDSLSKSMGLLYILKPVNLNNMFIWVVYVKNNAFYIISIFSIIH